MVVPATALISMQEYLATDYEPDCDFVDGVLEERNLGKKAHSRLQALLTIYLGTREAQWRTVTYTEQRVQLSPTRVRIPDICLVSQDAQTMDVFTDPPLLCIEILSPEDRMIRVEVHIQDFLTMGVPCIWVFDPIDRTVLECTRSGRRLVTEDTLQLASAQVSIHLPELFGELR